MKLKDLLEKFSGESERNAALTIQSTAILSALGIEASALSGKTADEISALVKAKLQPATNADAGALATSQSALATAKEEIKTHVTAHATLSGSHVALCASLGLKPEIVAGKSSEELKKETGRIVAARSAELLAKAGFSADQIKEVSEELTSAGPTDKRAESTLKGKDRYRSAFIEQVRSDKVTFARVHKSSPSRN